MGFQMPFIVPNQFLCCKPSRTLHIAAFNLSNVQRWIQGCTGIVQNIGPQDAIFTSQRIDHNFRNSRTIGKVEKRLPFAFDPVLRHIGGFVKPCGRQADAGFVDLLGSLREGKCRLANMDVATLELDAWFAVSFR